MKKYFNQFKQWISTKSPTQQIALSFLGVILVGTFLLMLPISNAQPLLPFIDYLFTATSAVCVTGLSTLVVQTQFSVFGKIIMIILMQIGGLGLMTLIAIFLIFLEGKLTLATKKSMSEAVNRNNFDDFHHFIQSIVKYTIFFEVIGILVLSTRFVPEFGLSEGLFNATFISISAFCNAGFDPFGANSLANYVSDPIIILTVASLIVMGGLGFGVWFDISQGSKLILKGKQKIRFVINHFHVHVKLVIFMTVLLIVSGFVFFVLFEFSNPESFGPLSLWDKLLNALFHSITLRTAGFSFLNVGNFRVVTLLFMMIYMVIGGSPGGTAGGFKTTTFAILILMVIAELRGKDSITVYHRSIGREQFRKAFIIVVILLSILFVSIMLLSMTESFTLPEISFEAASAIATVGLSTGITANLSYLGKWIIILLMFIGRIGPLTMILSINTNAKKGIEVNYPKADILIG